MKVGIIILAAGASKRMGSPKLLLDIDGDSMLKLVVDEAMSTNCYPISVVIGAHSDLILSELKELPINIVDNPSWESGMASSIKVGLAGTYLLFKDIEAVIVTTADMPDVNCQIFKSLIEKAMKVKENIVASRFTGYLGVPALFKRAIFEQLLNIQGEEGAKQIFAKNEKDLVGIDFDCDGIDIDTKEDYFNYLTSKK